MRAFACRNSEIHWQFLLTILCVGMVCAAPSVLAQTTTSPTSAAEVHPFDANLLREPVEIGTAGLVKAGDNPAYSRTDFDDSKWIPVDAKARLSEYFPHNQSPIVWRRLHIKVDPGLMQLALQAYDISGAFEVYLNGQRLIQSGQIEPYVAYTSSARLIARIPEAQARTGTFVIAARARAPLTLWTNTPPAFNSPLLTLGDETALRKQNLLDIIGENAADILETLLALGVGLVALALFIGQRQRREYFWIFILGVFDTAQLPFDFLSITRNIPVNWWVLGEILFYVGFLPLMVIVQAFLRKPLGWLLWLCSIGAFFTSFARHVLYA